jgi:hypothetical protein
MANRYNANYITREMSKKLYFYLAIGFGLILAIYLANLFTLKIPVNNHLSEDYRNEDVEVSVRYSYYINPKRIAVSLDQCSNTAPVDILRALLQTAEALENRSFNTVELHNGYDHRFSMSGNYFKELGEEYDFQNPIYTARTLPENIFNPDGTQAYYNYRSGIYGLSEEMESFTEFTLDWCIE